MNNELSFTDFLNVIIHLKYIFDHLWLQLFEKLKRFNNVFNAVV